MKNPDRKETKMIYAKLFYLHNKIICLLCCINISLLNITVTGHGRQHCIFELFF